MKFATDKQKSALHQSQKPVKLLEYLIKMYTNEGGIVLDSCMGSGSTGVACVHTNRDFIGIEKDDAFYEIAKERIEGSEKMESESNLTTQMTLWEEETDDERKIQEGK